MKNSGGDRQIIIKILNYCEDIELTHEYFKNDKKLFFDGKGGRIYRNAITMPILQIGELAKNLSEEFVGTHNAVSWKAIMRTRDFFAHHYWDIEYDNVWNTSHEDIKILKDYIKGEIL